MRVYRAALVASIVGLASCGIDRPTAPVDQTTKPAALITRNGPDCAGCIFGPVTYYRGLLTPRTEEASFSADADADYVIDLNEGTRLGADAEVMLNGEVLLARRTDRRAPPRHVRRSVPLKASNLLKVTLYGVPWTNLTVSVVGGAKVLGTDGGIVTAPSGIAVTIPAGALGALTEIRVSAETLPPYDTTAVSLVSPLVRLEPEGQVFLKKITLSIPVRGDVDEAEIFQVIETTGTLVWNGGTLNAERTMLQTDLSHFSLYAGGIPKKLEERTYNFVVLGSPTQSRGALPALSQTEVVAEVQRAVREWDLHLPRQTLSFVQDPASEISLRFGDVEELGQDPTTTRGVSTTQCVFPVNERLCSFSSYGKRQIVLNDAVVWGSVASDLNADLELVEAVAKHEFGHMLSLSHPRNCFGTSPADLGEAECYSPPVMSAFAIRQPLSLTCLDLARLAERYPEVDKDLCATNLIGNQNPSPVIPGGSVPQSQLPSLSVVDAQRRPVPGATVYFRFESGPSGPVVVQTKEDGIAALPSWRAAGVVGTDQRVTASVWGFFAPQTKTVTQPGVVDVREVRLDHFWDLRIADPSLPQLGIGLGLDQFSVIPRGTFQMGSNLTLLEQPIHTVTISSFLMQRTEVTQAQWRTVMTGTTLANPSSSFSTCGDTCPVDQVSFDDIQVFLVRLNAATPGVTYRLPTEAEWEYAARANTTAETYGILEAIAWYNGNSGNRAHPVAGKTPNAFGLYDMLGNVWERVNDFFGNYAAGAVTDPTGPAGQLPFSTVRGASWTDGAAVVRAGTRTDTQLAFRGVTVGFRLVRTP